MAKKTAPQTPVTPKKPSLPSRPTPPPPKRGSEKNGSIFYVSQYRFHNWWGNKFPLAYKPNYKRTNKTSEFNFTYHYNNLGFRGPDVLSKKSGEHRMIVFGDSFTEGVGTPDDFTFPYLLQGNLRKKYGDSLLTVINMGRAGCDPIFDLHELMSKKNNYLALKPDMIILATNVSDVTDIVERGGRERFQDDKLHLKTAPWWEFFYSWSYYVRWWIHGVLQYHYTLMPKNQVAKEYEHAAVELEQTIVKFNQYCESKHVKFVLVIMPIENDLYRMQHGAGYGYGLEQVYQDLKSFHRFPVISLRECYYERMMKKENQSIKYYWPIDFHHNQYGYQMFADCVSDGL
jgi:hypothetical protein